MTPYRTQILNLWKQAWQDKYFILTGKNLPRHIGYKAGRKMNELMHEWKKPWADHSSSGLICLRGGRQTVEKGEEKIEAMANSFIT